MKSKDHDHEDKMFSNMEKKYYKLKRYVVEVRLMLSNTFFFDVTGRRTVHESTAYVE